MRKAARILLAVVAALLVLALVVPLVWPVPPLRDTVPPEQLAGPGSHFVSLNGLQVHYEIAGRGEPVTILLHGFGASTFSWREVMPALAQRGTVIAYDRPGFGLTERPMPGQWSGASPYSPGYAADQAIALMDALGVQRATLVGNSAGGAVAALVALNHPERVQALVLVDAAIYGGGAPDIVRLLGSTPQGRRIGPLVARSILGRGQEVLKLAWHDQAGLTPEVVAGYVQPTRVQNWDRALWEFTLAGRPFPVDRLGEIRVPTLVITGDDDRIIPPTQSVRLAGDLKTTLVTIPACGHVPQEEKPGEFMQAVSQFLDGLD